MNLLPYAIAWTVAAAGVAMLAIYRKMAAGRADELLHLNDQEANAISMQTLVARQVETIDRWGKILTAVVALAGLGLAGMYVYQTWIQTSGMPQ